jgi:glycine cleavage system H protein
MILYTVSHEWIRVEGKKATVGITAHAQKELGEIVHIELPAVNSKFKMGEELCVLESTKPAADVYAPVSGEITAVNCALKTNPSLINQDAEGAGYLFEMELSNASELESLLTFEQYQMT